MNEMIETVARAIAEQIGYSFDDCFHSKREWIEAGGMKGDRFRDVNEPYQIDYLDAARAAIEAMPSALTLEMQMAGAEALGLFNAETDGPAKPHEECETPYDWMTRGANIAGRMQSGAGMTRAFNAMIAAALSSAPIGEK
jgi:hypothetical protein